MDSIHPHSNHRFIMAFDIGIKNFAVACIEVVSETNWMLRFVNNTNLDEYAETVLGSMKETGPPPASSSSQQQTSVRGGLVMQQKSGVSWAVYRALILHLESTLKPLLVEYRPIILIEQQMSSKHKSNIKALRLSQHLLAYFLNRYPSLRVVEFSSKHKTRSHSGEKMTYSQRKKWAVEKVLLKLEEQGDEVGKEWILQWKKQDDVADCVLMCLVYAGINFV